MNISSIMKNKNYSSQSKIQCAFKTKNRSCFFFITSAIHKSNHVSQCSSSIWEPSYPLLKLFFFQLFSFFLKYFFSTNKQKHLKTTNCDSNANKHNFSPHVFQNSHPTHTSFNTISYETLHNHKPFQSQ